MSLSRRFLLLLVPLLASAAILMQAPPLAAQTPVNLGNFVWDDWDGDGAQDVGEPGLAGITVQLWNATKTQLLDSAVTNSNGTYTVQAPGPGDYRLRVVLPAILDQFSPKDLAGGDDTDDSDFNPSGSNLGFTDSLTIASNVISIANLDCGLLLHMLPGHTIGNRVFRAPSGGLQPDENAGLGFTGTVELLSSTGVVLQTTTTRQLGLNRGYYGFNAPPGTYRLRFIGSAGYIPTPNANAGDNDTLDSDIDGNGLTPLFTLAAGQIRSDLDAGFVLPVNLGNFVWNDQNGNGVQDAGEPGIPNVVVELWNADRTRRLDSGVTNANGNYILQAPGPGDYRIWVLRPLATDTFSPKLQGGSLTADSNIIPSGADFGFTDVISVASNVISMTSIDAGIQFAPGRRSIPRLEITQYSRATGMLSFTGPVGGSYQMERSALPGIWSEVGEPFVTTGSPTTVSVGLPPLLTPRVLWRVRRTQ